MVSTRPRPCRSAQVSCCASERGKTQVLNTTSKGKGGCAYTALLGALFLRLADGDSLAYVAHLEAGITLNRDVLAQLADDTGDQLRDGNGLVFDEGLLIEADFLVELAHFAFDNLLHHLSRLARGRCLRAVDVLLFLESLRSHVFFADEARIGRRNVHGDVVHQVLEVVGAGDKVALAVDLNQDADLASRVDVAGHGAFAGGAGRLLSRSGNAFLAQPYDGGFDVSFGLGQCLLAVHHGRIGLVPKFLYLRGSNVHGACAHFVVVPLAGATSD